MSEFNPIPILYEDYEKCLAEWHEKATWLGELVRSVKLEPPTGEFIDVTVVNMNRDEIAYRVLLP